MVAGTLFLSDLFHCSLDHSAKLPVLLASLDVRQLMKFRFLPQLDVAQVPLVTQLTAFKRHQYCATDFARMCAITETTILRESVNIREAVINAFADGDQAQFPHARCINE